MDTEPQEMPPPEETEKFRPQRMVTVIPDQEATPEKQALTDQATAFAEELSDSFRGKFWEVVAETEKEEGQWPESIRRFIEEKGFDLPRLCVAADTETTNELIESFDLEDPGGAKLRPDEILVVFNLPKPLDFFWRKGHEVPTPTVIGWGNIYERTIPNVWDEWDEAGPRFGLEVNRLNQPGEHEPGNYYYVWAVSQQPPQATFPYPAIST